MRPPAEVRDALLDAQEGVEGARWQDDDQLHLTVRFVGEIDDRAAQDLAFVLDGIDAPSFALDVRGAGLFERKGRAHTLWAGITPSTPLTTLQAKVERACQVAGLAPEPRKFAAHVTLARLAGGTVGAGAWVARHAGLSAPPWPVTRFGLYESRLGKGGSSYTLLADWPLAPTNR